MIEDKKIKKGAPKRNPECYQTLSDIVIPAGTILRDQGSGKFGCGVGAGQFIVDETSTFAGFKKVIA